MKSSSGFAPGCAFGGGLQPSLLTRQQRVPALNMHKAKGSCVEQAGIHRRISTCHNTVAEPLLFMLALEVALLFGLQRNPFTPGRGSHH